jgi:hypothetical protein
LLKIWLKLAKIAVHQIRIGEKLIIIWKLGFSMFWTK